MDTSRQGVKSNPIGKTGDFFTPSKNFCMEASLNLQGHGAYARQVIILATDSMKQDRVPDTLPPETSINISSYHSDDRETC